ncbi:hypothetical protein AAC387_Pa02g2717 [Persea americana]
MVSKRNGSDSSIDAKKRKRVGFSDPDVGIEANECIKVFLVSRPEEMDAAGSFSIDPVDLNHFFGEDGKIYGYKDLKIHIWFNIISFRAYADITYQSTFNGSKDTTNLKPVLRNIFGESLVEQKDEFLQSFSTESHYIRNVVSNGEVVKALKGHDNASDHHLEEKASTIQVIRMDLRSMPVGELYSRLVPLVLVIIDGGTAIDITDPRWEIYFLVERKSDESGENNVKLLGFTTIYRFYHYPDSSRLRISQILVLPPYHGKGHGRLLLETLNSIAVSEDAYDVTVEEPSDYLQYVRACIDTLRLLSFEPVKPAIAKVASQLKHGNLSKKTCEFHSDPPASLVEDVRKMLKINKKQLLQCWEVLIYLNLNPEDPQCMENYKTCISDRVKVDILGKDVGAVGKRVIQVPNNDESDTSFVLFRPQSAGKDDGLGDELEGIQENQGEQLSELFDERVEEIKAVAKTISRYIKL